MPEAALSPRVRVLLVDDEALIRRAVRRIFSSRSDVVIEDFEDAALALLRAETTPFDVALLDLQMPAMTGVELAERLRQLQPTVRVVYMTANPMSALAVTAASQGEGCVVPKPWASGDLIRAVAG